MQPRALLAGLLGVLMLLASGADAALSRQELRQKCYEGCMKKFGWKPVCVYSPNYPKPTSHMPTARWVMPNACAMKCQSSYARYQEYYSLKVKKSATVPKRCSKNVQAIYFDWSLDSPACTTC